VRLGQAFDTMRVIEDGLKGDERVVVNGLQRAIPRREVSPGAGGRSAQPRCCDRGRRVTVRER
jgi:multidrug efflux pump subunit AcrA (membrane-fusion protein)